MDAAHALDRIQERLTEAGWSTEDRARLARGLMAMAPKLRGSWALKLATLDAQVGVSWGDRSNGNEVWAIVRGGSLVTVMLRRETQPKTPEALKVDNVKALDGSF